MRLAVAFGVSSLAVWILGPLVKASGFDALLELMGGIAVVTLCVVLRLPHSALPGLVADESTSCPAD